MLDHFKYTYNTLKHVGVTFIIYWLQ